MLRPQARVAVWAIHAENEVHPHPEPMNYEPWTVWGIDFRWSGSIAHGLVNMTRP